MEAEETLNPWITVPKRKRNHTFAQNDATQNGSPKSEVENLQSNSFINLSLQESMSEDSIPNRGGIAVPGDVVTSPLSPGIPAPPRKRTKKDPKKVHTALIIVDIEKSHYPAVKIRENSINRQVNLTDFRDLILWMLDDTSSPEWIEIQYRSYIRACVVLHVPGLSPRTFNVDPTCGSEGRRMRRLIEIQPSPLPRMTEIFKYMWLPKAPGSNTQLYSPLQAFLNCPLSSSQNLQRAREQSKQKGNSIKLESLVLNSIEMRNAGYPTHPFHEDGLPEEDIICTPYTSEPSARKKTVIGMDCEMCLTEQGSEVTRVTLVDFQGNTLYDELVKPKNAIIDYLTIWSGITEERLLNIKTTLATIQAALTQIIDSDTILVGHSLECDLQALKLAHPHVIDTSVIYQHSRGPPYKPSLKWLAQKWLKRNIQENPGGHDSAEDAKACIDLVKLKCQRGKEFGLFNVDMESLFARFKRRGVDSAVVEYGNRGSSFYGDKVRTCISAESDKEVIEGILEVLQTNHGFVWSRLKEVENAAKWKDNDSTEVSAEEMEPVLTGLDENISRLWEELPPCTALMVITGSGDPREMSRLHAKKRLYDSELRVKKWDDITVKWMDEDQQAYALAVDKARTGLGFIAIK